MDTHIAQLGNSQGVRISRRLLDSLQLKVGQRVRVSASDGAIRITPAADIQSNAAALEKIANKIAAEGGIPSIPDPIKWQKEQRALDRNPWEGVPRAQTRTAR